MKPNLRVDKARNQLRVNCFRRKVADGAVEHRKESLVSSAKRRADAQPILHTDHSEIATQGRATRGELRRHLLVLPLPALRVGFDVPLPKRCRTGQISYTTAQRPRGGETQFHPTLAHEVSRNESKIAATGSAPHGGGHRETAGSAGARQRCSPGALMWQQVEVAVGRAITTTTVCLLRFHLQRETLLYLFQVQTIQTHPGKHPGAFETWPRKHVRALAA